MKNMKKMMAIVITMVMILAMAVPSLAADDHTITINQTNQEGTAGAETYNLYKIFDVTKTEAQSDHETSSGGASTETGFSYTISTGNPWFAVLGSVSGENWSATSGQTWVTLTPSAGDATVYTVTWVDENTEAAAKGFAEFLKANKGAISADKNATSDEGKATVDVSDGYWLIDSSLGTNLILATTDIDINTKNSYPTTEKDVAKTNYNVGDFVDYTITVNLPATTDWTKPVIVHDTLDEVLNFKNDITATSGTGATAEAAATAAAAEGATTYTTFTVATADLSDNCTFEITMDINAFAPSEGTVSQPVTVIFKYTAELLSTAYADTDYVNKEFVEYSQFKTSEKDATIRTYDFDLVKHFDGAEQGKDLEATFNLYASDDNGKADSPLVFVEETKYVSYVKADSDDTTTTTTIYAKHGINNSNIVNIRGLAEGTYYLTELTTADGYNLLTEDIVIVINADGSATVNGTSDLFSASNNKITIVNNSGTVLPSTGGIGTTIFYVIGGLLVVGAGVVLVSRRKSQDD